MPLGLWLGNEVDNTCIVEQVIGVGLVGITGGLL